MSARETWVLLALLVCCVSKVTCQSCTWTDVTNKGPTLPTFNCTFSETTTVAYSMLAVTYNITVYSGTVRTVFGVACYPYYEDSDGGTLAMCTPTTRCAKTLGPYTSFWNFNTVQLEIFCFHETPDCSFTVELLEVTASDQVGSCTAW